MNKISRKNNIIIACHETLPCYQAESLRTYLLTEYKNDILFIAHPLLDTVESYNRSTRIEYYKNNKLILKKNAFHWILPKTFLFIKNMLYTFYWSMKYSHRWDIFYGFDCIDVLVALFLQRIGKIDKVIYQVIDYYPTRFQNKLLNWLYFQFDKICVRYADETWNVNETMVEAREKKMGMKKEIYNKQYTVPMCVWVNRVDRKPFSKINKKKIIFRGSLIPMMGVDLIIKAMPIILKAIPGVTLEIYGDGIERKKLENEAAKYKVSKHIKFYGWIRDRKSLEELMSDAALGIATFNTKILDDAVRNADPSKIKDYTLMGMPVIITRALSNYAQIEKLRCGIAVDYDAKDLAAVVIKLLSNEKLLKEYRENALKFVKQFDCTKVFDENVGRILGDEAKR